MVKKQQKVTYNNPYKAHRRKKSTLVMVMLTLIMLFLCVNFISAEVESLQTQKVGTDIELKQIGADFSACNITSVSYPNSTVIVKDVVMTKRGNEYNYTLNSTYTNTLGDYIVNGFCTNGTDDVVWAYDFKVTYTGKELDTQTSIIYVALWFCY